jgi:hypothetical protein
MANNFSSGNRNTEQKNRRVSSLKKRKNRIPLKSVLIALLGIFI